MKKLKMRFDPQTVKHLGLKMYSQLPSALAEVISNSYDAYATIVNVILEENNRKPISVTVEDNGIGLTFDEINNRFLVIGYNRREYEEPDFKPPFDRKPTGKKGLGKLALFGLATTITISTVKDGLLNEFILDYDALIKSKNEYEPKVTITNKQTDKPNGTTVKLTNLKRNSSFDVEGLADNLSRIFIIEPNFELNIVPPIGKKFTITNERKYETIDTEFEWDLTNSNLLDGAPEKFASITGKLITSEKPIPPSSGLRGVTLYSRGKLVNEPEYFSESTSSHFYSYLTGWIEVDFIDELDEDVISTNRQSIVWDDPDMELLKNFLKQLISKVSIDWRKKRKENKEAQVQKATGIDTLNWISTLPNEVGTETQNIIDTLSSEEGMEKFGSIIESLHKIIPEYAELHWRYLNENLKGDVEDYYKNGQLGDAANQAVQLYFQRMRDMTTYPEDGETLVGKSYKKKPFTGEHSPKIRLNDLKSEAEQNIQAGQAHFSRGVYQGFRNPINHRPMKKMVPEVFSHIDCLNILSLVSYLMTNLDTATVDEDVN